MILVLTELDLKPEYRDKLYIEDVTLRHFYKFDRNYVSWDDKILDSDDFAAIIFVRPASSVNSKYHANAPEVLKFLSYYRIIKHSFPTFDDSQIFQLTGLPG